MTGTKHGVYTYMPGVGFMPGVGLCSALQVAWCFIACRSRSTMHTLFSPQHSQPLYTCFCFGCLACYGATQEIFHQQLPKMPKEYIVRLVFDRKHRSIVLTKNGTPIGGITYRAFLEQKFGEIAFCAVASSSQVLRFSVRWPSLVQYPLVREASIVR